MPELHGAFAGAASFIVGPGALIAACGTGAPAFGAQGLARAICGAACGGAPRSGCEYAACGA